MNTPLRLSVLLATLLASPALAQPASTSSLLGLPLPAGATLINDADATRDFATALRDAAQAAGSSCTRSEYVVWENVTSALRAQFTRNVTAGGVQRGVLHEETGDPYVNVFTLTRGTARAAGVWAEADGLAVLAWCVLQGSTTFAAKPTPSPTPVNPSVAVASPAKTNSSAWPAFGTFKPGDLVQVYSPRGWLRMEVIEVGVQPGQPGNFEKQYVVNVPGQRTWNDFYPWGKVAHLERQPYWTGFFIGDWKVGELMAVNARTDGTSAWNEVAYASATDTLRVRMDGTYEWKDLNGKVTRGTWQAAQDGPGIVVKDAQGRDWTLRNETNIIEERIRKLESGRLYPSDSTQMTQMATRPLRR